MNETNEVRTYSKQEENTHKSLINVRTDKYGGVFLKSIIISFIVVTLIVRTDDLHHSIKSEWVVVSFITVISEL